MKGKLGQFGLLSALVASSVLGSMGGTPQMGAIKDRSVAIGGVNGKKKGRHQRHGSCGHRRVAITGKPWIPRLDLRRYRKDYERL